jgi:hypothetical protein
MDLSLLHRAPLHLASFVVIVSKYVEYVDGKRQVTRASTDGYHTARSLLLKGFVSEIRKVGAAIVDGETEGQLKFEENNEVFYSKVFVNGAGKLKFEGDDEMFEGKVLADKGSPPMKLEKRKVTRWKFVYTKNKVTEPV